MPTLSWFALMGGTKPTSAQSEIHVSAPTRAGEACYG